MKPGMSSRWTPSHQRSLRRRSSTCVKTGFLAESLLRCSILLKRYGPSVSSPLSPPAEHSSATMNAIVGHAASPCTLLPGASEICYGSVSIITCSTSLKIHPHHPQRRHGDTARCDPSLARWVGPALLHGGLVCRARAAEPAWERLEHFDPIPCYKCLHSGIAPTPQGHTSFCCQE